MPRANAATPEETAMAATYATPAQLIADGRERYVKADARFSVAYSQLQQETENLPGDLQTIRYVLLLTALLNVLIRLSVFKTSQLVNLLKRPRLWL